jgi:Zn-dependent protease/CBS domain-containing protein
MNGFRIGRIFGLEIRIDYSWLVIFTLVLWSFTLGVFPLRFPGQPISVYFAMGLSGTLLFFVSVLLHEMAHSLVAQARGIPVDGITLFIFGGMAHARSEFETPKDEFIIAGVGPLSSFAIAGAFGGIAWFGSNLGWSVVVTGVAAYLAILNVILAVFNLLPGFPLDGGRLFRAVVWHYTGNQTRATRVASAGGRILGYLLIGLGILQFLGGGLIGGLWMVFIGWFVQMAASSGYAQHLLRSSLDGLQAGDAMTAPLETAAPELSIQQFVDEFAIRGRHEAYPVTIEDRPVGIISFRQVGAVPRDAWSRRTVSDTMTPLDEGATVSPAEPMTSVLEKLQATRTRRILVVEDGRLVGLVSAGDLARWANRARLLGGG